MTLGSRDGTDKIWWYCILGNTGHVLVVTVTSFGNFPSIEIEKVSIHTIELVCGIYGVYSGTTPKTRTPL